MTPHGRPQHVWLGILAIASLMTALATQRYQTYMVPGSPPIRFVLDLGLESAIPHLVRGFIIVPAFYVRGICAKNKEPKTCIRFPGLPQKKYVVRFKVRFFALRQRINLSINDRFIGTATPEEPGIAQKFIFTVPAEAIRTDVNELRCVHEGVEGPVDYELFEIRDYRSSTRGGHLRLYHDDPSNDRAMIRVANAPLTAGKRVLALGAGYFLLSIGLFWWFRTIARAPDRLSGGLALVPLLASVASQTIWYGVTWLSPYTLRISLRVFLVVSLVPHAVTVLIVGFLWVKQTIVQLLWAFLPSFMMQLQSETQMHRGRWMYVWILLKVFITSWVKWLLRNPGPHGLLVYMILYAISAILLGFGWRAGAEGFVNWAYYFLILAVAGYGWRALRGDR